MSSDTSRKKYRKHKKTPNLPNQNLTFPVEDLPLPTSSNNGRYFHERDNRLLKIMSFIEDDFSNDGSIIFPTPTAQRHEPTNQPLSSSSTASKPLRPQTHLGGTDSCDHPPIWWGWNCDHQSWWICWGDFLGGFVVLVMFLKILGGNFFLLNLKINNWKMMFHLQVHQIWESSPSKSPSSVPFWPWPLDWLKYHPKGNSFGHLGLV